MNWVRAIAIGMALFLGTSARAQTDCRAAAMVATLGSDPTEFNRAHKGADGLPIEPFRDPNSYNPTDFELVRLLRATRDPIELADLTAVTDGHLSLAAMQAFYSDRERASKAVKERLEAAGGATVEEVMKALRAARLSGAALHVREIAHVFGTSPSAGIRSEALALLVGTDEANSYLLAGLRDGDPTVRHQALALLQRANRYDPMAADTVLALTRDPYPPTRARAIELIRAWTESGQLDRGSAAGPTAPGTTKFGEHTLFFQRGFGPFGNVPEWRLLEKFPTVTTTPWTPLLNVGGAPGAAERILVNFPFAVGNHDGQVPQGAVIVKAVLGVKAAQAKGIPVEVHAVTEANLGDSGVVPGQDLTGGPSWSKRLPGISWKAAGASEPASSSEVLDVELVDVSYTWVEFDVTEAVREWAVDPSRNHGLLLTSSGSEAKLQGFLGGNAAAADHPYLVVTYVASLDKSPPKLEVYSDPESPVQRAFVGVTTGADAVDVTLSFDGGPEEPLIRDRATSWHQFVTLSPNSGHEVVIRARDGAGNVAIAKQTMTWVETDVDVGKSIVFACGDTVLLRAPNFNSDVTKVTIQPGDGNAAATIAIGQSVAFTFAKPGAHTSSVAFQNQLGATVGAFEFPLVVVSVGAADPVPAQVGYVRFPNLACTPSAAWGELSLASADSLALFVTGNAAGDPPSSLRIAPLIPGSHRLQARLGGPTGRIISEVPVEAFQLEHAGLAAVDMAQGAVEFSLRITPAGILAADPTLRFDVTVFSDGCSLPSFLDPDGDKTARIDASYFDPTGVAVLPAHWDLALAPQFCRNVKVYSGSTAGDAPGSGLKTSAFVSYNEYLGACCTGDFCEVVPPENCIPALGGVFKGPGTMCNGHPCAGACCKQATDGSWICGVTTKQDCLQVQQGKYLGDNTKCDEYFCQTCPAQIKALIAGRLLPIDRVRPDVEALRSEFAAECEKEGYRVVDARADSPLSARIARTTLIAVRNDPLLAGTPGESGTWTRSYAVAATAGETVVLGHTDTRVRIDGERVAIEDVASFRDGLDRVAGVPTGLNDVRIERRAGGRIRRLADLAALHQAGLSTADLFQAYGGGVSLDQEIVSIRRGGVVTVAVPIDGSNPRDTLIPLLGEFGYCDCLQACLEAASIPIGTLTLFCVGVGTSGCLLVCPFVPPFFATCIPCIIAVGTACGVGGAALSAGAVMGCIFGCWLG